MEVVFSRPVNGEALMQKVGLLRFLTQLKMLEDHLKVLSIAIPIYLWECILASGSLLMEGPKISRGEKVRWATLSRLHNSPLSKTA